MGGTYNIASTFLPTHSGTASAYITYKAYGDSDAWLVWTGGTGQGDMTMIHFYNSGTSCCGANGNYQKWIGLHFDGKNQAYEPYACSASHHLQFSNNYIRNTSAAGIMTKYCDYITSDHNMITHAGYLLGTSSGISYNSNEAPAGDTYNGFHNYITNNIISGSFDAQTNPTDGNGIILDLTANQTNPIATPAFPPTLIANNVVYQNGGRCIQPNYVTQAWVVNNTCFQNTLNPKQVGYGEFVNLDSNGTYFVNNVAYAWTQHNPYQIMNGGTSLTWKADLYYNGTPNFTSSGLIGPKDPQFVNPPLVPTNCTSCYSTALDPTQLGNALMLQSTSPAIDAGINPATLVTGNLSTDMAAILSRDINGVTRPQGAGYDLGAYEYVANAPSSPSNLTAVPH